MELHTKIVDNFIRDLIGIKDPMLKFDPRFPEPTQPTTAGNLVIHLIQTYPWPVRIVDDGCKEWLPNR